MRWTVSLHRVAEGLGRDSEDHLDWFFERENAETSGSLITFASGPDPAAWRSESGITIVRADRLPDHRPIYLDYRGEISGNRGRITPMLTGQCRWESLRSDGQGGIEAELVAVEICDRSFPRIVQLAESWEARLRSDQPVRVRLARS